MVRCSNALAATAALLLAACGDAGGAGDGGTTADAAALPDAEASDASTRDAPPRDAGSPSDGATPNADLAVLADGAGGKDAGGKDAGGKDAGGKDAGGQDAGGQDAGPSGDGGPALAPVAPVSGLMLRAGVPPTAQESFITSSVLMIDWAKIETAPSSYDFTTLDAMAAALAAAGVGDIKVRVMGGDTAPPWVKRLGSVQGYFNSPYIVGAQDCSPSVGSGWGGVSVQNVQGPTACIPFFWTAAYQAAYDALMQALAAHLVGTPKLASVSTIVDSGCMAVYAEVFYRGQADGASNHTLLDAGLTPAGDWACQAAAIATHARWFGGKRRTALAINDWDLVSSTNTTTYRIAAWSKAQSGQRGTLEFLQQVAEPALGADLELQNNGLHSTSAPGPGCSAASPTGDYFCYLTYYPYRHGFQTQSYVPCSTAVAGSCSTSGASQTLLDDLNHGLSMRAQFIELPSGMTAKDWSLMKCFDDQIVTGSLMTTCPE